MVTEYPVCYSQVIQHVVCYVYLVLKGVFSIGVSKLSDCLHIDKVTIAHNIRRFFGFNDIMEQADPPRVLIRDVEVGKYYDLRVAGYICDSSPQS
jgi:hypothetical protein